MEQFVHDQEALVPLICGRVAKGEFVSDVLRDVKVDPSTWYSWIDGERWPERAKLYAQARISQSHAIADEIQAIADGSDRLSMRRRIRIEKYARRLAKLNRPGWQGIIKGLESNLIARNRLQMDARKWYARSLNPKQYGDKVDVTSGGEPVKSPAPTVVQFVGPDGKAIAPFIPAETPGTGTAGPG